MKLNYIEKFKLYYAALIPFNFSELYSRRLSRMDLCIDEIIFTARKLIKEYRTVYSANNNWI